MHACRSKPGNKGGPSPQDAAKYPGKEAVGPLSGITGGFAGGVSQAVCLWLLHGAGHAWLTQHGAGERGLQQYIEKGDLTISPERQGQFSPLLVAGFVGTVVTLVAVLANQAETGAEAAVCAAAAAGLSACYPGLLAVDALVSLLRTACGAGQIDTKVLGLSLSSLRTYSPVQRLVLTVAFGLLGLSLTVGGVYLGACRGVEDRLLSLEELNGRTSALSPAVAYQSIFQRWYLHLITRASLARRGTVCGAEGAQGSPGRTGGRGQDAHLCRLPGRGALAGQGAVLMQHCAEFCPLWALPGELL